MLIAIDPGVHACGIAYAYAAHGAFAVVVGHVSTEDALARVTGYPIIVELPVVYAASKSKGDPEDLIQLARVVGKLEGRAHSSRIVRPNEWKGSVSKEIHNARILACAERVIPKAASYPHPLEQLKLLPKTRRHNAVDALGLWLFGKGLMSRRGDLTGVPFPF